jgi:hypothetical protein
MMTTKRVVKVSIPATSWLRVTLLAKIPIEIKSRPLVARKRKLPTSGSYFQESTTFCSVRVEFFGD